MFILALDTTEIFIFPQKTLEIKEIKERKCIFFITGCDDDSKVP